MAFSCRRRRRRRLNILIYVLIVILIFVVNKYLILARSRLVQKTNHCLLFNVNLQIPASTCVQIALTGHSCLVRRERTFATRLIASLMLLVLMFVVMRFRGAQYRVTRSIRRRLMLVPQLI